MNYLTITYSTYILCTVTITILVANYLFKNGKMFLVNAFKGNEPVANSVNNLLKLGFYLVNIGYALNTITIKYKVDTVDEVIRILAVKIGVIILILGFMHFFNLFILYMIGDNLRKNAPKPISTDAIKASYSK